MSNQYGPRIVTDGLVLCLDAGNSKSYPGTGTVWSDLSGNNNYGTLVNGSLYTSNNKGSISFDNINDYVDITASSSLLSLQVPLTIACWVMPFSFGTYDGIFSHYSYITGHKLIKLLRFDSGTFIYYTSTSSGSYQSKSMTTRPVLNKWHFCAVSVTGSISSASVTMQLNDTVQSLGNLSPLSSTPDTTIPIFIGKTGSGSEYFNGNIAQVLVYNRALSNRELSQNYNATKGRFV